jgi:hypothetical protein
MCSIKSNPSEKKGEHFPPISYNTPHQIPVSFGGEQQSENIKMNDTLLRRQPTELSISGM